MGIRATLAGNLRRLRAEKGMSQEELAHKADLDRTYISSLERQVYAASIDVVERLADALGVNPVVLFYRPKLARRVKRRTK
jgi:transcriptional regulator with XRE-family HTH domain